MDGETGVEGWVVEGKRRGEERGDTMWAKTKTGNKMTMKGKKDDDNNRVVQINE